MKVYQENIIKFEAQSLRLKKVLNRMSLLRLLFFLVSLAILITLFSFGFVTPALIVFTFSVICFAFILRRYDKIAYLSKQTTFLKTINDGEILREKCELHEFDPGDKFKNQNHPYTSDLDIFGQHSIFQLLNRTTTESGMILLAKWLSDPAPNNEIFDRQKAIKEISQKLDWRQDFQASGMHFQNNKSDYNKLLTWVEQPTALFKNRIIYTIVALVLSSLTLFSIYFFLVNANSPNGIIFLSPLLITLLINYLILRKVKPIAEDIVKTSQENIDTLRGYQTLINKIECEHFHSEKLAKLKALLTKSKYSASKEIKKLCKLLDFSQQRGINKLKMLIKGNPFYSVLNIFLLIDIYLIIGIEKWKSKNQAFLKSWAEVVSEFEVINSLAGFCYSNPSHTFPEITEKHNCVHFEMLGHPLIPNHKRVCNNFHSEGPGNVVMITGSNMGGKSTFLRTVGVNLVLALTGAPCCAKYGQVTNLKIYTSMRTQDNLMKGISSFYAELNRIEKMLKLIANSQNVFFLLDEMFKGTNSEDRHKGGFSLIQQISNLNTSGIIATHDIELAKLSEHQKLVTNYSFNSEIKDNSMIFSYELQSGICIDFNASELMRKSGIKILSNVPTQQNEFRDGI